MDETWSGGHLNDPSWWWAIASDGVLGGIIGGLVTAWAVWLTLRHERRSSRLTSSQDAAGRMLGLAAALLTEIGQTSFAGRTPESDLVTLEKWWASYRTMQAASIEWASRMKLDFPGASAAVATHRRKVHDVLIDRSSTLEERQTPLSEAVADVIVHASTWLGDPKCDEPGIFDRAGLRTARATTVVDASVSPATVQTESTVSSA
ncbi:hypothetical protein [Nocardioides lianchengensis]|uniref:hypothetical protein n=1 Tax=Nocardioides lianchengensis TaxID=1045774 RepID=UPI0011132E27|nr:hypothetical protein [Nocardioides lianchengensis]NYG12479.1 hypothetical protein [Nocardioides lianchengensis]